jgi:hypothetical protein
MLWKIKASCERIKDGSYEIQFFTAYANTALECFECLLSFKDKGEYFVKDIHIVRIY